ncbi:MAG: hypothetical protein HWE26_15915 [Alteromonadaceae bacterium]|nr:hypothetical protein [Alteromonadaceae bacterium]
MATLAVGATALGQAEVAAPAALISVVLGYAAAVQGDNPVQEVVVEAVVNFSAKPIGVVSKGAAIKLEGKVKNGVESAGQFLENKYKDLIKSEK